MTLRLDSVGGRIDAAGPHVFCHGPTGPRSGSPTTRSSWHRRVPVRPPIAGLGRDDLGRTTACTCCTRWATRSPSWGPSSTRPRHRPHRRRRLHRAGDGRGAHRPRPGRHPDRAAPRGPADRRPRARGAGPRRARRAWRRGPDRHHRPADQPGQPGGAAGCGSTPQRKEASRCPGRPTWSWSWSASGPTPSSSPRRRRARCERRDPRRPGHADQVPHVFAAGDCVITHHRLSARRICRSAPPRTSRAGSPARTPSAGTASSPAASAPRS